MTGHFVSLSPKDFESILDRPERAIRLVDAQVQNAAGVVQKYLEEARRLSNDPNLSFDVRERYKLLLKTMETDLASKSGVSDDWNPGSDAKFLDIDKSWDVLNALLTLNEPEGSPLGFILGGGCNIPNEDFGYGPPHGFTPEEIREIAVKLEAVDTGKLITLENLKKLEDGDLYCFSAAEDEVEYVQTYLDELKAFVAEAAKAGKALVVYLS